MKAKAGQLPANKGAHAHLNAVRVCVTKKERAVKFEFLVFFPCFFEMIFKHIGEKMINIEVARAIRSTMMD